MKLLNTLKYAALTGLATLALPMSAQAALNFGQWTVTTDTTNTGLIAGCPSGVPADCTVLVTGEGFLQQQYDDGTNVYIQTIVTDPTANATDPTTLPYSDESFVRSSGTSNGIAGKQSMSDASFNFSGSTTLYTGWAATTDGSIKPVNSANLNITQGFTDPGGTATGDEFSSSFGLKINLDVAGNQTGKSMSIGQIVEMGNGTVVNSTDIQSFIIEQRSGDMLTNANPAGGFKLGNTSFDVNNNALNGTNNDPVGTFDDNMPNPLTWQADDGSTVKGDDVMLVWLGQQVSDSTTGGGLSKFGFERATVTGDTTNASVTPDQTASTFSTDTTGIDTSVVDGTAPFNWDAATFGTIPTLPTP